MSKKSVEKINKVNELGRQFSDATVMMHAAIAQKVGLAPSDHKYLGILMEKGPMPAGELSDYSGLTTGATTGLIDRLEKKGFVKRKADKVDRRKVMIVANQKKLEETFGGIFGTLAQNMTAYLQKYSEKELDTIIDYLTGMVGVMKDFEVRQKT